MAWLRRFIALPPAERQLVLTAAVLVPALRLALLALPFAVVARAAARRARSGAAPAHTPERIAWAVRAAGRRVPLGGNCLAQALAVQTLLASDGHVARLRIGVARTSAQQFRAHAWVETADGATLDASSVAPFTALPALDRDRL